MVFLAPGDSGKGFGLRFPLLDSLPVTPGSHSQHTPKASLIKASLVIRCGHLEGNFMTNNAKAPKKLMDAEDMDLALSRMAAEVAERKQVRDTLAIIGIRRRGVPLGRRLADKIEKILNRKIPFGILDITLYRDDLTTVATSPILKESKIDFDVNGKSIILVDDVLYTGRTIRAALDALIDYGRPARVEVAVLIDRGHRELPIHAEYIGKVVPTSAREIIEVKVPEEDGMEKVLLVERQDD
jgi:pyrimidine operon attenuation protein/uracil phosphoribosyltransferase